MIQFTHVQFSIYFALERHNKCYFIISKANTKSTTLILLDLLWARKVEIKCIDPSKSKLFLNNLTNYIIEIDLNGELFVFFIKILNSGVVENVLRYLVEVPLE